MITPPSSSRSQLASAIKALRERRGLTQQQFADVLGVTLSAVAKYETTYKPNRAMLRVLQNMSEDYGMPELVPIFVEAAARPISQDSQHFSGRARLEAATKYVVDATELLAVVPGTEANNQRLQGSTQEVAQRLKVLREKVDNLVRIISRLSEQTPGQETISVRSERRR